MKQILKRTTLQLLRRTGVFRLVRDSAWRKHRLLILCYHGISPEDEHLWRPGLYLEASRLEQRLALLRQDQYNVLRLGEALRLLRAKELPPRSVAITFDDGTYDFFRLGYPLLRRFGFPVTVYQTTYYSDRQVPVFSLICSYLLWKRRGTLLDKGANLGLKPPLDLRSEANRHAIVEKLMENCDRDRLDSWQKNEVAARLADLLDIDYAEVLSKRTLQLMNAEEIAQLAREGVDFQLHTHRHRMPKDKFLFQKEIRDNRESLQKRVPEEMVHFCYPGGVHSREFLPWLAEENIVSATTCDVGLAGPHANPLLLPRMVETNGRTALEFEAWLTGVADLLAVHRTSAQRYIPRGD
ncbi:MAG: polysaccharide deacetylase family protein [Candidatus Sulfotelmatobacter sp.]